MALTATVYHVDLTRGTIDTKTLPEDVYRKYPGGSALGEGSEHPARRPADLRPTGPAWRAPPARDRVGHQHALAGVPARPGRLVSERARIRWQHRMAALEHLDVRAARRRGVHANDDLALRVGHVLYPQVTGSVQQRRPHGTTTALSASPLRVISSARPTSSRPMRCETSGAGSTRPDASSSSAARTSCGPAE